MGMDPQNGVNGTSTNGDTAAAIKEKQRSIRWVWHFITLGDMLGVLQQELQQYSTTFEMLLE